ncbi:MAG: hypothetical protein LBD64_08395 [Odoribacteraceae bacterium]|jgi:hypothetical protein|nr:hypothetical protein [Odoribacteraceae bacterium]
MKKIILALVAFAALSCSDDRLLPRQALFLTPAVEGTRATVNYTAADYFSISGLAETTVQTKSAIGSFQANYGYAGGKLSPLADTLWFPYAGESLDSLRVWWPALDRRVPLPFNQEEREVFLAADWLKSVHVNVPPAGDLPVVLRHERSKLTFTLTGANAGAKIISLSLGGYAAYCDPSPGVTDAQLIFDHSNATGIFSPGIAGTLVFERAGGGDGERVSKLFTLRSLPALQQTGMNYTIDIEIN